MRSKPEKTKRTRAGKLVAKQYFPTLTGTERPTTEYHQFYMRSIALYIFYGYFKMHNLIKQYCRARIALESKFLGLQNSHGMLLRALINQADISTGRVESISYRELSQLLFVESVSGRKNTGILGKQSIRGYIRLCRKKFSTGVR